MFYSDLKTVNLRKEKPIKYIFTGESLLVLQHLYNPCSFQEYSRFLGTVLRLFQPPRKQIIESHVYGKACRDIHHRRSP